MGKKFKDLKPGDTIFLVGSPDFITHEFLVDNFSYFIIETIIPTQDGHGNSIICLGGKYAKDILLSSDSEKLISYFTVPEDYEINGYQVSIRIDKWSEKFTRTISEYQNFLCFRCTVDGLCFLENRFTNYIKQFTEDEDFIINDTLSYT